jgi:tRNA threonylcarbamoyladenosine biosynthesis protein TsaE
MAFVKISLTAPDAKTTQAIAAALARMCHATDCILLHGDLGAGKTTFARGFIQSLRPRERAILSPTFSLVQTYVDARAPTIWHFDLYRLQTEDEVVELGLEEALRSGIILIEWPELSRGVLHGNVLDVVITMVGDEGARRIDFAGAYTAWHSKLEAMEDWNAGA